MMRRGSGGNASNYIHFLQEAVSLRQPPTQGTERQEHKQSCPDTKATSCEVEDMNKGE